MKTLSIAYYTFIKYFRNIIILLAFVLSPLIILSLTTGSFNTKNFVNSGKENVGFYYQCSNPCSTSLKKFLTSDKLKSKINLISCNSYKNCMDKINKYEIDSFIYVDSNEHVKYYSSNNLSTVKMLLQSFMNSKSELACAYEMNFFSKDSMQNTNISNKYLINNSNGVKDDAGIVYILLFIVYGCMLSASIFLNDKKRCTYMRHLSAPVSYTSNFLGKSLGSITFLFVTVVLSIFLSKYILKVNWNGNMFVILSTFLVFIIMVNGIGIILASLLKKIYMCVLAAFILNYSTVYPMVSKAFDPNSSSGFDKILVFSPHYYAFRVISSSIYGNVNVAGNSFLILTMIALVTTLLAWILGRRLFK